MTIFRLTGSDLHLYIVREYAKTGRSLVAFTKDVRKSRGNIMRVSTCGRCVQWRERIQLLSGCSPEPAAGFKGWEDFYSLTCGHQLGFYGSKA